MRAWQGGCQSIAEPPLTITLTSFGTCRALGTCACGGNVAPSTHSSSRGCHHSEALASTQGWLAAPPFSHHLRWTGHHVGPAYPLAFRYPEILKDLSCPRGRQGLWDYYGTSGDYLGKPFHHRKEDTEIQGLRRLSWGDMANYCLSWDYSRNLFKPSQKHLHHLLFWRLKMRLVALPLVEMDKVRLHDGWNCYSLYATIRKVRIR